MNSIEINTASKVITLKDQIDLKVFIDKLDEVLGEDWENYSITPITVSYTITGYKGVLVDNPCISTPFDKDYPTYL